MSNLKLLGYSICCNVTNGLFTTGWQWRNILQVHTRHGLRADRQHHPRRGWRLNRLTSDGTTSVWHELAKNHHIGQILKDWSFLYGLFSFGQILNQLWQYSVNFHCRKWPKLIRSGHTVCGKIPWNTGTSDVVNFTTYS